VSLDGISLPFLLLTTFMFPFCFLSVWKKRTKIKTYLCVLFFLEFSILGVFLTNDLLFFFVFFECSLFPMFFMIGVWGSGINRLVASYYYFFFTAIGSVFLYFCIFVIYLNIGGTNISLLNAFVFENVNLSVFLFIGIIFSFLIKLPMFPFHI